MLGIEGISVTEAYPGVYALLDEAVDVLVEPCEVILSFLLFSLCPAALQARIADSGVLHILAELGELGIITVHRLGANAPAGGGVEAGLPDGEFPDDGQGGGMVADVLPGHRFT